MVRLKHRYLVVEVKYESGWKDAKSNQSSYSLMNAINNSIRNLHGTKGFALAKAGLLVKYLNMETKMCFLRTRRSSYEVVASSLPLITNINGQPVVLKTLHTSATIRHSMLFLQKYQRKKLEEKYASLKSDVQRKEFELELKNVSSTQSQNLLQSFNRKIRQL